MMPTMTKRPDKKSPADQRPRGGPARNIADIVPNIGRAAFRRFGFVQSSIVTRWDEIVGSKYAEVSAPESIRFPVGQKAGGTLSLIVASGFAPMMQHVLPEIVERVNRFFGYNAVAKVAMRQGTVEPQGGDIERRPPPRMLRPIPVELGDSLRDIGDPELRAVLESLAQGLANSSGPPKIGER
ncbi:DUF721 domain-containing protein [Rhizorhapis sp. SPR117]|uniref:DUF721 domain-containing protein n=1 Tax=Rhizorhapis sp. SPR117 TaxID=2912611 RepID=UPI00403EB2C6